MLDILQEFWKRNVMKKIGVVYTLLLCLIMTPWIRGANEVRLDSVNAYATGTAILPVYFTNDEELSAVQVILKYDTALFDIDSFSTVGTRVEYIDINNIHFRDSANLIEFWVPDYVDYISIGEGLLCNLFFAVKPAATGQVSIVDSAYWPFPLNTPPYKRTMYSDTLARNVFPDFVKGYIDVFDAPPTNDSVWVDSVESESNQQIAIMVYGKNEEDLAAIDLSLTYSSPDISYFGTSFENTRGVTAAQTVEVSGDQRQIHINLNYGANPLAPGSGPLAIINFYIPPSAPDGLVTIDSISYLGLLPLKFHQSASGGGLSFVPYFVHGHINIKSTTPVAEEDTDILPKTYALFQNNPNPFNPTTTIEFDLPRASHVKLDVFNILGQKVARIIDNDLSAGHHAVNFNSKDASGQELATGIYLYKLQAGDFAETKKMLLLK